MTEMEIINELKRFAQKVFSVQTEDVIALKNELDRFVKENNITATQMLEFAESGAGEMFYMMTC